VGIYGHSCRSVGRVGREDSKSRELHVQYAYGLVGDETGSFESHQNHRERGGNKDKRLMKSL
jgi:hypothetical protein